MKTGISVDIARPIEDVFILANDHVSAWSSIVVEDELLHLADDGGVGTKFRTVTEDRGRRMEFDGEVVEYEPPTRSGDAASQHTGPGLRCPDPLRRRPRDHRRSPPGDGGLHARRVA
jgi:hypothetical protein